MEKKTPLTFADGFCVFSILTLNTSIMQSKCSMFLLKQVSVNVQPAKHLANTIWVESSSIPVQFHPPCRTDPSLTIAITLLDIPN